MELNDLLELAHVEFQARVAAVSSLDWERPTPCTDWTVHNIVGHVAVGDAMVRPWLSGKDGSDVRELASGIDSDPLAACRRWASDARAAFDEPGALDGVVAHPIVGEMPALQLLVFRIVDNAVHAWDVAIATGQDDQLDPQLVASLYELVEPFAEMIESSGQFDPREAPENATAQEKLLALFGRDPDWAPAASAHAPKPATTEET
ncbi:MAG: hypothetical protein QOI95_2062 [Acidimicrobiaceae bacterium]